MIRSSLAFVLDYSLTGCFPALPTSDSKFYYRLRPGWTAASCGFIEQQQRYADILAAVKVPSSAGTSNTLLFSEADIQLCSESIPCTIIGRTDASGAAVITYHGKYRSAPARIFNVAANKT